MINKKIVPIWLSIVLVALCVFSIGANIYGIIFAFINAQNIENYQVLKIFNLVFFIASSVLALVYCFKGYKKDANKIFKLCSIVFTIVLLLQVAFNARPQISQPQDQPEFIETEMPIREENIDEPADRGSDNSKIVILSTVMFGCMMVLSIAENLGKNKSFALAGTVVGLSFASCLTIFDINNLLMSFLQLNFGVFVNAVIYGIMIYAKYQDKEARGTK